MRRHRTALRAALGAAALLGALALSGCSSDYKPSTLRDGFDKIIDASGASEVGSLTVMWDKVDGTFKKGDTWQRWVVRPGKDPEQQPIEGRLGYTAPIALWQATPVADVQLDEVAKDLEPMTSSCEDGRFYGFFGTSMGGKRCEVPRVR